MGVFISSIIQLPVFVGSSFPADLLSHHVPSLLCDSFTNPEEWTIKRKTLKYIQIPSNKHGYFDYPWMLHWKKPVKISIYFDDLNTLKNVEKCSQVDTPLYCCLLLAGIFLDSGHRSAMQPVQVVGMDPRRFKHRHDAPEEVPCIIYKYIHLLKKKRTTNIIWFWDTVGV